ncbi:MAG: protein kinase, partial [Candidatus Brocadiae bacterium]|nr:protein kinase [Candidatus Brocadiia bacterium]
MDPTPPGGTPSPMDATRLGNSAGEGPPVAGGPALFGGQTVAAPGSTGSPAGEKRDDQPRKLGAYHVVRRIGRGGMGTIYLGVQTSVGREVAIKVLPSSAFDHPEAVERFEREVQVLGQLSHPHICPVLEAGVEGETRFYVMEYLRGLDLSRILKTQRIDPVRAAAIASQIARALQHAHEHGIVHRDVKPLNVMLLRGERRREDGDGARSTSPRLSLFMKRLFGRGTPASGSPSAVAPSIAETGGDAKLPSPEWQDKAVLIDFGLARDAASSSALTVSGAVVGTPAYMAPEQARGDRKGIGPATDIYSLGATLYEMLSLQVPFAGESIGEIINAVVNTDPPPLRKIAPHVDRDLETIVQKAMEKDAARRYASAADMATDLDRWLAGEPIQARRASLVYRMRRRIARNPLASAAIAAAVALAGAGLWLVLAPGEIELQGDLRGARVFLDGGARDGPVLRVWPPGKVRLVVERDDCRPHEQEFEVKARSRVPVVVDTPSLFGTLRIESTPAGAQAWCGGRALGTTPLEARLTSGAQEITLRLAAHVEHVETVVLESGGSKTLRKSLIHEMGLLTISADPPEAGMRLKHVESGETLVAAAPLEDFPAKTGIWIGESQAQNHRPRPVTFEVRKGEMTRVAVTLPALTLWTHTCDPFHSSWVAGDLNGDRYPDILVANGKPGRLRAIEGRTGRLLWIVEGLPDAMAVLRPLQVDIADLDGDLRNEVLFGGGGQVSVLEGATGTLRHRWTVAECENAQSYGDHDGDGIADIFVWTGSAVGVLRGLDGRRIWWKPLPAWPYPCPARLDADGAPDIILHGADLLEGVSGADGRTLWHRTDGAGNYHFAADLNGDGFDDGWVVAGAPTLYRAISGVDGKDFATLPVGLQAYSQGAGAVADLDGDGVPEILQPREEFIEVIALNPMRTLQRLPFAAAFPRAVFLDLTGDGLPEILIPSRSSLIAIDPVTWSVAWRYELAERVASTPLLADFDGDGRQDIAIQSEGGVVHVLTPEAPPLLWRQGAAHYFTETPAADGDPADTLFIPGTPARTVRARDGLLLAETALVGRYRVVPVRVDGALRYAVEGSGMAVFDPAAGKTLWDHSRYRGWTRPYAADLDGDGADEILFGDRDSAGGTLEAFRSRDGGTLWKAPLGRPRRAAAALVGTALWVPVQDGTIRFLDPATGKETGAFNPGSVPCSIVADGPDAVFTTQSGRVARARLGDRGAVEILWSRDLGLIPVTHSPAVGSGTVVVAGISSEVVVLDARTGEERWRRRLPVTPGGMPSLRDLDGDGLPEVAAIGADGYLTVLRGADGTDGWTWNLRAEVSLCVPFWCDLTRDGRPELVVLTRDGRAHAFQVELGHRPIVHWPHPRLRSPAQAGPGSREEATRQQAREAWREGR